MIDLTSNETVQRMRELGVTEAAIHNLPIDAVVRYNSNRDGYVLKGPTGVRFQNVDYGVGRRWKV